MKEYNILSSNEIYRHQEWTGRKATAQMYHFQEIFINLKNNYLDKLDELEDCNGTTSRNMYNKVISDITITMVYQLVEGFFFMEYYFYIEKINKRDPKKLSLIKCINEVLKKTKLQKEQIHQLNKYLDTIMCLTQLRHSIMHQQGYLDDPKTVEELQSKLKTKLMFDFFHGGAFLPKETLVKIVHDCHFLLAKYGEFIFDNINNNKVSDK